VKSVRHQQNRRSYTLIYTTSLIIRCGTGFRQSLLQKNY